MNPLSHAMMHPLTEIIGRKLYITDFGREIAVHAKEIIDQMDAIKYKTLSYQGRLAGKLKLAVVSTGKYIIPYFLSEFLSQKQSKILRNFQCRYQCHERIK